jgi:hypothetical protein
MGTMSKGQAFVFFNLCNSLIGNDFGAIIQAKSSPSGQKS